MLTWESIFLILIVAKKQFFSIKILYYITDERYNIAMKENNIESFKELELKKKAKKNLDTENKYQTDPFKAKFRAFQKTKKEINVKDLF